LVDKGNLPIDRKKGFFVVDFDGTLLRDDKQVAFEDIQALATLRQYGIATVVATGRSFYSFQKISGELAGDYSEPFPLDYVILSTGAGIVEYGGGSFLHSLSLQHQDILEISRFLDNAALNYMIHRPVPDTHYFLYRSNQSRPERDFEMRLEMYREFATPLTAARLAEFEGATEILVIVGEDRGDEVSTYLSAKLAGYSVIRATSPLDHRSAWIEIFPEGVSKSGMVAWLSRRMSVPRKYICAVGNDYNDLDLLEWAGMAFLVANAPVRLHNRFSLVSDNNSCGVKEAADRFLNLWAGDI
jgi:HAD superfamily hydrolase (TIGR01484 family)